MAAPPQIRLGQIAPTTGRTAEFGLFYRDAAYLGAWSSGVTTVTVTSVPIPNNVVQISNGSTSPLISVLPEDKNKDLLFRTTSPDTLQGVVDAQLAAGEIIDNYQSKTASTIYVSNPYGQGLSNAFARSLQLPSGTVHAQIPPPGEGAADIQVPARRGAQGRPGYPVLRQLSGPHHDLPQGVA